MQEIEVSVSGSIQVVETPFREIIIRPGLVRTIQGSEVGRYGEITSDIDATARLHLPVPWTVEYENGPGRPVLARRGGRMTYRVTSPFTILIGGDYSRTDSGWHPTDEAGLFGVWRAGDGHRNYPGMTAAEGAMPIARRGALWAPIWSPDGKHFSYDAENQGIDNIDSFSPTLDDDVTGKVYTLRGGGGDWRPFVCSSLPAPGEFTMYLGIRFYNTGWPGLNQGSSLVNLNTTLMGNWGGSLASQKGGLFWYSDVQRFQATYSAAPTIFGAKPAPASAEQTLDMQRLTVHFAADGRSTIYSGGTVITSPIASAGAPMVVNQLQLLTTMPVLMRYFAIHSGAPTQASRAFFSNF